MERFKSLSLHTRSLCPTEAEIWVLAEAESVTPMTELHGRLIGPTCAYSATIEVAYPLQPFPKPPQGLPPLARRVVIPEPSFWSPALPALYRGVIELWRDGVCVERRTLTHGLRAARLGPDGLVWNGKPLRLQAVERSEVHDSDMMELHRSGCNALILPVDAKRLWDEAERLGFLGIGRTSEPTPDTFSLANSPACLGWLLPGDRWQGNANVLEWIKTMQRVHRRFVGVEVNAPYAGDLPEQITFVVGPADLPRDASRPRLLRGGEGELGRLNP